MKINKNSWHYKLVTMFSSRPPNTLCSYFWRVFFRIVEAISIVVGVAMLAALCMYVLIAAPLAFFSIGEHEDGIVVLSVLVWFIAIATGVFIGLTNSVKHIVSKLDNRSEHRASMMFTDKKPNFVMAYLKAKKEKVCPLLEFE